MKRTYFLIMLIGMIAIVATSCKKDDENNDDNNNNSKLPDAVLTLNVSGAESHNISFTLPENVASDYAINGAHVSASQLLTINSMDLPVTWSYGIVAQVSSLQKGTYSINAGMSSFKSPTTGAGFSSVTGTLELTKVDLYQNVASVDDYFIDGEFTGTYQDTNTPPNIITISGSFSGINIKAQ